MQDLFGLCPLRVGQVWAGLHKEEVALKQHIFSLHDRFKGFHGSEWTGELLTFVGSHEENNWSPSSSPEDHWGGRLRQEQEVRTTASEVLTSGCLNYIIENRK